MITKKPEELSKEEKDMLENVVEKSWGVEDALDPNQLP